MHLIKKISDEKIIDLLKYSVERENRQLARTQVASKVKAYPLLCRSIKESKINLTVASAICPHLAKSACPEEFIRRFFGKTKRQAEEMLLDTMGVVPVPRDEIRPVGKRKCEGYFSEPTETVHKISFAVREKFLSKLATAKDLLSHKVPDGALERIFEAALDQFLKANASSPRTNTNSPKSSEGRYIPRAMAFEVRKKSGDRCEFLGATGRCSATKFLVIDHIRPLSNSGKTEAGNLQILCAAHNHFKAELDHGRDFIGAKINGPSRRHRNRKLSMIGERI